jgi:uracil DNA glycosylase
MRLEIENLDDSWLAVLKDELTKPYFLKVYIKYIRGAKSQLKEYLKNEMKTQKIFPPGTSENFPFLLTIQNMTFIRGLDTPLWIESKW